MIGGLMVVLVSFFENWVKCRELGELEVREWVLGWYWDGCR